jgi:HNH endonuclease
MIPWELKYRVYTRDKWRCVYCGYDGRKSFEAYFRGCFECDHRKPRSLGGEDTYENLVTACGPFNSAKGHKWFRTDEAAAQWLQINREEVSRPWFEHHVVNAGPIAGWNRQVWGPAWDRLKQLYNEVKLIDVEVVR